MAGSFAAHRSVRITRDFLVEWIRVVFTVLRLHLENFYECFANQVSACGPIRDVVLDRFPTVFALANPKTAHGGFGIRESNNKVNR